MRAEVGLPDVEDRGGELVHSVAHAQGKDLLDSMDTFGRLQKFRHDINRVKYFGDFVFEVCPELLCYAYHIGSMKKEASETYSDARIETTDPEGARLRQLAKQQRRSRVEVFNSEDGIAV